MKRVVLTLVLALVIVLCGCVSHHQQANNTTATNTTKSYLKDILIQPMEDNTTKITLIYEFPDTSYNVTLLNYSVQGKVVQILTRITKSNETALPIITEKKIDLTVEGNVTMAVVMDILPKERCVSESLR